MPARPKNTGTWVDSMNNCWDLCELTVFVITTSRSISIGTDRNRSKLHHVHVGHGV